MASSKNGIKKVFFFSALLLGVAVAYQNCAPAQFSFVKGGGGVATNDGNDNLGDPGGGGTGSPGGGTGSPGGSTGGATGGSTGGSTGGGTGHDCECPKPPCVVDYPNKKEVATAVWEDLFPGQIDADYNDFVTNFKINEQYSTRGLEMITIDFIPRARGAGYDHKLLFIMDGNRDGVPVKTKPLFQGDAEKISLIYYDINGNKISEQTNFTKESDLIIFKNTKVLFKNSSGESQNFANVKKGTKFLKSSVTARVVIKVKKPELNPAPKGRLDISRYRMMLYVWDTAKYIDLIDINSSHFDSNGYPYGVIVPADFKYPLEQIEIDSVYEYFPKYRMYLFNKYADPTVTAPDNVLNWFNFPSSGSTGRIFDRALFN
jgi:LruC domain-containing protein